MDVGQSSDNSIFVQQDGPGGSVPADIGFGPGLRPYDVETSDVRDEALRRVWVARNDLRPTEAVWVLPGHVNGRPDGSPDAFTRFRDVIAVRHHGDEEHGPWVNHYQGNLDLDYADGERIRGTDVVLWYLGHFLHQEPLRYAGPAPCGDAAFPPIFAPNPRLNCNDLFGAGPTLVVVQGDTEVAPKQYPWTVSIERAREPCGATRVSSDSQMNVWARLTGVPPGGTPRYRWEARAGALLMSVADERTATFAKLREATSLEVALRVDLLGVTRTTQLAMPWPSEATARMHALRCAIIGRAPFNYLANPLLDPARDLDAKPYSATELHQLDELGRATQRAAQELLVR